MRCHRPPRHACSPNAHPLRTPAVSRREARAAVMGWPVAEILPAPSRATYPEVPSRLRGEGTPPRIVARGSGLVPSAGPPGRLAQFRHTRRGRLQRAPASHLHAPGGRPRVLADPHLQLLVGQATRADRKAAGPPAQVSDDRILPDTHSSSAIPRATRPLLCPVPVLAGVSRRALRACARSAVPPTRAIVRRWRSPVRRAGPRSRRFPMHERPPYPVVADPAMSPRHAGPAVRPPAHARPSWLVAPALRRDPAARLDTIAARSSGVVVRAKRISVRRAQPRESARASSRVAARPSS